MALVARHALLGGRRAALVASVGVATGLTIWTLAASVGLAALLRESEPAFVALKVVGVSYLVFLGVQALAPLAGELEQIPVAGLRAVEVRELPRHARDERGVPRAGVRDCRERFVERKLAPVEVGILGQEVAAVRGALLPQLSSERACTLVRRSGKAWIEMREVRQLAAQCVAPFGRGK